MENKEYIELLVQAYHHIVKHHGMSFIAKMSTAGTTTCPLCKDSALLDQLAEIVRQTRETPSSKPACIEQVIKREFTGVKIRIWREEETADRTKWALDDVDACLHFVATHYGTPKRVLQELTDRLPLLKNVNAVELECYGQTTVIYPTWP